MVTVHYLLFCLERRQKEREATGMGEVAVSLEVVIHSKVRDDNSANDPSSQCLTSLDIILSLSLILLPNLLHS